MSLDTTNPLNIQNYINKDFQTIYPELLDLVKKITYKWDPTISNESDPGVVLIKLNALIADKNNYNIDKNILECFPDTVTQEGNAYNLYSQLGYDMHWYIACEGKISARWKSANDEIGAEELLIELPQFTMVSDNEKNIVYTILGTSLTGDNAFLNTKKKNTVEYNCIQGIIKDYAVGTNTKVTLSSLDSSNKIYLPVTNVAENGIYIQNLKLDGNGNIKEGNWFLNEWERVHNLHSQPLNTKCYRFGVDHTSNLCYIEFPLDIANLIGDGLQIKYIQTNGAEGIVPASKITTPYQDINVAFNGNNIVVTNNIEFSNNSSIANGKDPESIDDAYINYQKTVATFDTLVTLRDYINYALKSNMVSNGIVTDRTNDIQSSYKIVSLEDDGTSKINNIVSVGQDDKPEMSAFDLKTYFFTYSDIPYIDTTAYINDQKQLLLNGYNKSFEWMQSASNEVTEQYLSTDNALLELFNNSKSLQHNFIDKLPDRPLLFKNKFKLNITIIPHTLVTNNQAHEIELNVYKALYNALQSKNISFGKEISYESIYDICHHADSRIKAIALDNIEYTPYALVYMAPDPNRQDRSVITLNNNETTELDILVPKVYEIPIIYEDNGGEGAETSFNKELATDILAKNILAGVTPLYKESDGFKYKFNQLNTKAIEGIEKISTSTKITFDGLNSQGSSTQNINKNESIFLYAPNFIEKMIYENGAKYIYYNESNTDLEAHTDHKLGDGVIYFFWTEEATSNRYSYARYEGNDIVNATSNILNIYNNNNDADGKLKSLYKLLENSYTGEGLINDYNINNLISQNISGEFITSTSRKITIKGINQVDLPNKQETNAIAKSNQEALCYWVTNDVTITDNKPKYKIKFECEPPVPEILESHNTGDMWAYTAGSTIQNGVIGLGVNDELYLLKPYDETFISYFQDPINNQWFSKSITFTNYTTTTHTSKSMGSGKYFLNAPFNLNCTNKDLADILYFKSNSKTIPITFNAISDDEISKIGGNLKNYIIYYLDTENNNLVKGYDPKIQRQYYIMDSDGMRFSIQYKDGDAITTSSFILYKTDGTISNPTGATDKSYYVANIALKDLKLYDVDSKKEYDGISDLCRDKAEPSKFTILGYYKIVHNSRYNEYKPSWIGAIINNCSITNTLTQSESINKIANMTSFGGITANNVGANGIATITDAATATATFKYNVKNNEYFLYTNRKLQTLNNLGKGTTISLSKDYNVGSTVVCEQLTMNGVTIYWPAPIEVEVDALPSNEIIENGTGTSNINNLWYDFYDENGYGIDYITVTENQIINIGEDSEVRVTLNNPNITGVETIGNYNKLIFENNGVFKSDENNNAKTQLRNLNDYTIQYKEKGSNSWSTLPPIGDNEDIGWEGYSILNINSSPDSPQILDSHREHAFKIKYKDSDSGDFVIGTLSSTSKTSDDTLIIPTNQDGLCCIQTDVPIQLEGGINVDTTKNINGNIEYLKAYCYNSISSPDAIMGENNNNGNRLEILENGDYQITLTNYEVDTDPQIIFNCSLPNGVDKLLHIEMVECSYQSSSESIKSVPMDLFSVAINSTEEWTPFNKLIINQESDKNLKLNKHYILNLTENGSNSNEVTSLGFKLKSENTDDYPLSEGIEIKFKLYTPFCYNTSAGIVIEYDPLLTKIQKLDKDNIYNYMYQPSNDVLIENPLDSKTFFNPEHICNSFTIPQIENININIMNRRG